MQQDKHTSTLIRKKWRKVKQYSCCGKGFSCNFTKPQTKRYSCTLAKFYKSRNGIIFAKQEIRDITKIRT